MSELMPGQLVRSLAGRDHGSHYLVLEVLDERYVLLVNGRSRPVERPKKKNIIHLQHYARRVEPGKEGSGAAWQNSEVIRTLKELTGASGLPEGEVNS